MVNAVQLIGGYKVPLLESVSLNKVSYDIESPQLRLTDFSRSIIVPATPSTNKLFENLFMVTVALQTFNPNLKTSYELIIDGVSILRGYCQLIDITNIDGSIKYRLQAKGSVGDLFQAIGEGLLEDLDFQDYDHTWNETNVVASWTPTLGQGYVYPMIDYGFKTTNILWYTEDFKPALFVREYLLKIFQAAGYTWTSTFLDSTRFKSLIIPQSSDTISLSDTEVEGRQFLVGRETTNQTGLVGSWLSNPLGMDKLIFNNDSISPYYNTQTADYNIINGRFMASDTDTYTFKGYIKCNFVYTETSSYWTSSYNNIINKLTLSGSSATISFAIVREQSGGVKTVLDVVTIDILPYMIGQTITASYTSPTFEGYFTSADLDIESGDKITLRLGEIILNAGGVLSSTIKDYTFTLQTTSAFGAVVRDPKIVAGDTIDINSTIPREIKQTELLNAIIKRFNLYMEADPNNDKNIIIEPLSDFITSDIVDIDRKVDRSREYVISPLGALKNGTFLFKDKEGDTDIINSYYEARKPHSYGYRKIEIDNDFLTEAKEITTIFSPCPLVTDTRDNDRVISSIAFPREAGEFATETAGIKLLYWGGLLDTNYTWYINGTPKTTYPYAGHLDNPYDPNFDLCWGVPKLLFYDFSAGGQTDLYYTDKNCYNLYWGKHITEIIDKDSKILTCYLMLDSHGYAMLSFRKLYFIDGVYWRLLEVSDFTPLQPKTTKCKFLKLKDASVFSGEKKKIFGGGGVFTEGEEVPKSGQGARMGKGSGTGVSNLFFGEGIISGKQAMHNSDGVLAATGFNQSLTSGSNGARLLGKKVAAINSPDVEIVRDGQAFVNGVSMEQKVVITLTATQMKLLNSSPIMAIDSVRSDEYIKVTRAYIRSGGGSFTGGTRLLLKTDTSESVLAQTSTTFFDTSNNTEILELGTEALDFGEGLSITQSSDMGGTGSEVTLTVIYQIIQF